MSLSVNSNSCPSPEVWADFLRGDVSDTSLDYLSNHLVRCSGCLAVLARAEEPSTIPTRREFVPSPYLTENNYFRLLAWVETLSSIGLASDDLYEREGARLPSKIGRFDVQSVLGAGAFGRVYLAHDPLLNRTVAIKAPLRSKFGTDSDLANFLNEARHAAALDHRGIVQIYDVVVEESGRTLIVMKHINGNSLAEKRRHHSIGLKRSVQIIIEVARAVHHAHERGFVHRDLKPANILVDEDDKTWVTDFGLGLCLNATNSPFDVHGGTAQYMSPEQVRRDPSIDRRSDIWALGIMLAELVHGTRPFPQANRTELYSAITSGQPEIKVTKETAELDEIVRQCLAKSPDQRFATAEILAERLSRWEAQHFPAGIAKWMYGWRRLALVFALSVFALSVILANSIIKTRQNVNRTLSQLEYATPQQLPKAIDDLLSTGIVTAKLSKIQWSDISRWKLDTALIALGDRDQSTISRLCDTLQTAEHDRLSAIVEVITKSDDCDHIVETLLARLANPDNDTGKMLRLAATLAQVAPKSVAWDRIAERVCLSLSSLPPNERRRWVACFNFPGNHPLTDALTRFVLSNSASDETKSAAVSLAELLSSDRDKLLNVALRVDSKLVPIFISGLQNSREAAIDDLANEFSQSSNRKVLVTSDETQPNYAELNEARIAILLWLLGNPQAVCEAVKHRPNPTLQTLVIHGLADQIVNCEQVLALIHKHKLNYDPDSSAIKMSLLQVLALAPQCNIDSVRAFSVLNAIWQNDPDGGVHSSAKLLALRLGISLEPLTVGQHGNWLVERIGGTNQDFYVIDPCVSELGTVDGGKALPPIDPWPRHTRKFNNKFVIGTNEVTIEQFQKLMPDYEIKNKMLLASTDTAAMLHVTLESAYRFCNALSIEAGFDPCYELSAENDAYLVPKPNHLKRNGYRLPTDGEWELACRANTVTDRYFGDIEELASQYGWLGDKLTRTDVENGMVLSQSVSTLLPNRWGLFDTYGNAMELCDESVPPSADGIVCEDVAYIPLLKRHATPLIRGSCIMFPKEYAKSFSRSNQIVSAERTWFGFRLARTLLE